MDRKRIIGVAFVLWLVAVACGSGSGAVSVTPGAAGGNAPAATSAPAQVAKVGDRVQLGDMALTVAKTERKPALSDFQKAKDGYTFLVADVTVENTGSDKSPYNLLYFKLRDGDGFEYNPAIGVEQAFQSGELDPAGKARGNVAFEVKEDAKGLVIEYKPLVIGSNDAIKVAID